VGLGGRKVLIYTGTGTVADKTLADEDLKDFEGTARSGGAILKKLDGDVRKMTITGIHRRAVNPRGKFTMWHTIWSDADAITVTGSGASRTLDGTMYVMHNRAQRKITKTLTGVVLSSGCRFPTAGTTNFAWSGGSVSVTWGSCGSVTIDGTSTNLETDVR
jgi:hypothetical protein